MGMAMQRTSDPAEVVASVAAARRELLLRAHRQRLRHEDLEDCYSQATLELVLRSRRSPFASIDHVKNALEQKFDSRINDRRRALAGRSGIEAALANAVSVDGVHAAAPEVEDRRAGVERQVEVHGDIRRLREVIAELSLDQRLVLHSQVNLQMEVNEFCERYGWSAEKFRKVAQRARAKLRTLVEEYQSGERCRRLEPDLLAFVAGGGSDEQLARVRRHVENCSACAHQVAALNRAAPNAAAAVTLPAAALLAPRTHLGWLGAGIRRVLGAARHPAMELGTGGAAGVAGGSTGVLVLGKAGVLAICIAGAAGGYAVCEHIESVLAPTQRVAHEREHRRARTPDHSANIVRVPTVPAARHPLTDLAQVKREFGAHRAALATAGSPPANAPVTPTRVSLPAQSPATVGQEATEFGFER
jgi:DNA-directed RNA polymerase specialized sigma24 family protein